MTDGLHTQPAPFDPMAIILVMPPNGEETAQDATIALTHDPTTGPPAITTGTEDRPVTLGNIRNIMTHSMREFQHSIQQNGHTTNRDANSKRHTSHRTHISFNTRPPSQGSAKHTQ